MEDYDQNKESPYLQYWHVNNLYDWAMGNVYNFEWIEDISQFNEHFIKNYNEESDKGYFLEIDFNILKNYMNFTMIYHFYLNESNWKSQKACS